MNKGKLFLPIAFFSLFMLGCVSQSDYQQSLQRTNEAMSDKERYMKYLADTKRELNKLKDEYQSFEQVSKTVLEDKETQLAQQKQALQDAQRDCNAKVAQAQQDATQSCERYQMQAKKWQAQEDYMRAIATKNQNISQSLRDSVLILDSTQLRLETKLQAVYLIAQEPAFFKKDGRLLEKNGRVILAALCNYIRRSPDLKIYILSYHSAAASEDENWKIASSRAQQVALFLQGQLPNPVFTSSSSQKANSELQIVLSLEDKF